MPLALPHRSILVLLVVGHALLAGAYSVWNPLAEAPDEADHMAYVRYLTANRHLPIGTRVTQSKHPPLYHSTAAVVASVGDAEDYQFLRSNPDVSLNPSADWSPNFFVHTTLEDWPWKAGPLAFHMARLWSVLLSTATVAASYYLIRLGFPDWPGLALAVAGVLAFIPEFAFIGASVNNDNGAALLGTLILCGVVALYWRGGDWRRVWWAPVAMGLGLLTKASTLALWPVVMLAVLMGAARETDPGAPNRPTWSARISSTWRRWLPSCLVILAIAGTISAPWLVRNFLLYGDLLGYSAARHTIDLRTEQWTFADTIWLLKGWFQSFWGKFGGAGHIPMPQWVYGVLAAVSLASAVGLVPGWLRFPRTYRPIIALLVGSVLMVILVVWRYSLVALGTDQGRLLYPAVAAIAALLALGIAALTPARWRPVAGAAGITCLAALGVYGLLGVIRPAFAPPPTSTLADTYEATATAVDFGSLHLVDWELAPDPVLFWYAPEQPNEDWRTTLRVATEDGSLVWEWRRSPGYGRFSTDRWPARMLLEDRYAVVWPEWAGPGRYIVDVAVAPFDGEPAIPTADSGPVATDGQPRFVLGVIDRQ